MKIHPLKKMRFMLGLSQSELANFLNTTQSHLSHIEQGDVRLTSKSAYKIIMFAKKRKYDLTLDELLEFNE